MIEQYFEAELVRIARTGRHPHIFSAMDKAAAAAVTPGVCARCKKPLTPADTRCPHCGAPVNWKPEDGDAEGQPEGGETGGEAAENMTLEKGGTVKGYAQGIGALGLLTASTYMGAKAVKGHKQQRHGLRPGGAGIQHAYYADKTAAMRKRLGNPIANIRLGLKNKELRALLAKLHG